MIIRNESTDDGFCDVKRMKLPDAMNTTLYSGMTPEQCQQVCLANCICRAITSTTNVNSGSSSGCVIWTMDLVDMRQFTTVI